MNKVKLKIGIGLLFLSMLAFATNWYLPFKVPGSYAADLDTEWAAATNTFLANQLAMNANGSMKPTDTVTVEYGDGTIVDFTLGAASDCAVRCSWNDEAWDPNKPPKVRQGSVPKNGKVPTPISVNESGPFPGVAMSIAPTVSTPTWTISIVQYGGGCDLCSSTSTSSGSGGGGGGGGGGGIIGSDPEPCDCNTDD